MVLPPPPGLPPRYSPEAWPVPVPPHGESSEPWSKTAPFPGQPPAGSRSAPPAPADPPVPARRSAAPSHPSDRIFLPPAWPAPFSAVRLLCRAVFASMAIISLCFQKHNVNFLYRFTPLPPGNPGKLSTFYIRFVCFTFLILPLSALFRIFPIFVLVRTIHLTFLYQKV